MVGAFPSDGVGHLAADAGLLRQHHPATVVSQPAHRSFHKLGVSHKEPVYADGKGRKVTREFRARNNNQTRIDVGGGDGRAFFLAGFFLAGLAGDAEVTRRCGVDEGAAFIACNTTGRSKTISSRYRCAAMACPIAPPGTYPSAETIKASFGLRAGGLRRNPLLRRDSVLACAIGFSTRNRRMTPS